MCVCVCVCAGARIDRGGGGVTKRRQEARRWRRRRRPRRGTCKSRQTEGETVTRHLQVETDRRRSSVACRRLLTNLLAVDRWTTHRTRRNSIRTVTATTTTTTSTASSFTVDNRLPIPNRRNVTANSTHAVGTERPTSQLLKSRVWLDQTPCQCFGFMGFKPPLPQFRNYKTTVGHQSVDPMHDWSESTRVWGVFFCPAIEVSRRIRGCTTVRYTISHYATFESDVRFPAGIGTKLHRHSFCILQTPDGIFRHLVT